ncbi:MAG: autotransporter domain-containing protein [Boseongicola sp. SB0676_bin_33]|nr:autotransporter domain-containing protein [Boseongicola sp. SB0676_bin_33]MYI06283.1 autotransporter domain-containing protein [Gemmatimonadota bacterium]
MTTGFLGADAEWDRLLAGVAVSISEGDGTFDQPDTDSGTLKSSLTTVSPYARVNLSERVSARGLLGLGTGDMTIVQAANATTGQPYRVTRTELSMALARWAAGGVARGRRDGRDRPRAQG